jgi:hypothetical protein
MDNFIDSMNLMTAHVDEDGDPYEALQPKHTFNPVGPAHPLCCGQAGPWGYCVMFAAAPGGCCSLAYQVDVAPKATRRML